MFSRYVVHSKTLLFAQSIHQTNLMNTNIHKQTTLWVYQANTQIWSLHSRINDWQSSSGCVNTNKGTISVLRVTCKLASTLICVFYAHPIRCLRQYRASVTSGNISPFCRPVYTNKEFFVPARCFGTILKGVAGNRSYMFSPCQKKNFSNLRFLLEFWWN